LTISRKKFFVPLSILVAIAIIGIVLWRFLPKQHVVPLPPSGKPTLAILYFENISGDKSLDPWKTALTELLITKLSQSKFISVLDGNTIYSILKRLSLDKAKKYTKEDLLKIANQGKATYTLSGSLMKAGPNLIMTLSLQKPHTGEVMSTPSIEIKSDMNLSPDQIAEDIDKHLGAITSHSPEAFKDFTAARNLQRRGLNRESIAFYERAIALDPEFASAFLLLSFANGNLGYKAKENEYLQKAFELRDKVSERESLLIQAHFFYKSERTVTKAEELFKILLQLYPEDYFGNISLGNLYYQKFEEWKMAGERFEVCIQHQYDPTYPYGNQATIYRAQGLYDKAREVCDYYLNSFGDNASIHLALASTFLCQGQYENALKEIDRASFISPNLDTSYATKGDAYCCLGDFSRAEIDYQSLLSAEEQIYHLTARYRLGALYVLQGRFEKSKEQAKWGIEQAEKLADDSLVWDSYIFLAGIDLRSGKYNEALEECNKALNSAVKAESLTRQIRALHLKGLTCLKMKSIDEAKRTADELKRLIDRWPNKKFLRYYYHLIGTTELAEEKFSDAIKDMDKARSLLPFQYSDSDEHAQFIESLALAYYRADNLEKARTEYEAITLLTTGRLRYGDIYAKSFYMLGKIAEKQGDKTHAREQYQKLLDLWKDADPGTPEVEDARKRLAAIS
jgi:tetratricopeptide (TPR) repeat protein